MGRRLLTDFELMTLLAILRIGDEAYGVAIRQEIHRRSGRDVSINAVYTTLDRLERKGLLESWVGDPTPEPETIARIIASHRQMFARFQC